MAAVVRRVRVLLVVLGLLAGLLLPVAAAGSVAARAEDGPVPGLVAADPADPADPVDPVVQLAAVSAGSYGPLTPVRAADTRPSQTQVAYPAGKGRVGSWQEFPLPIAGEHGVPDDAAAVVLNITVVDPATYGHVTVWPCGQPVPNASSLNYLPGQTVPNAVVSGIGGNGSVCLTGPGVSNLIVDVAGYFPGGQRLRAVDASAGGGHPPLADPGGLPGRQGPGRGRGRSSPCLSPGSAGCPAMPRRWC